jgi:hypothetical protein
MCSGALLFAFGIVCCAIAVWLTWPRTPPSGEP